MKKTLDGVPIKTDRTGKFCDRDCPLLAYCCGTFCVLECKKEHRVSRYSPIAQKYERCPECFALERKRGK